MSPTGANSLRSLGMGSLEHTVFYTLSPLSTLIFTDTPRFFACLRFSLREQAGVKLCTEFVR